jgi:hypothetical protein
MIKRSYKKSHPKALLEQTLISTPFSSRSTNNEILREIKRESFDPPSNEISPPKVNEKCFPTQESHPKALNPSPLSFLKVPSFGLKRVHNKMKKKS